MIFTIHQFLLVLALVCFGCATLDVKWSSLNFVALGLFLATLSLVITR